MKSERKSNYLSDKIQLMKKIRTHIFVSPDKSYQKCLKSQIEETRTHEPCVPTRAIANLKLV